MTIERMFSMRCDNCGDGSDSLYGAYANQIWEAAKADGWKKIKGKHYCEVCVEERENGNEAISV